RADEEALEIIEWLGGSEHRAHAPGIGPPAVALQVTGEQGEGAGVAEELLRPVLSHHLGVARECGLAEVEGGEEFGVDEAIAKGPHAVLLGGFDGRAPQRNLAGTGPRVVPAVAAKTNRVGEGGPLAVYQHCHRRPG